MKELSLNILDITYNSIKANAEKIEISISESISANLIQIEIKDNGHGMDHELLEKVTDPFVTTRTTRKVGLGIPLFKQSAEDTDGKFSISSKIGEGTAVYASFRLDHLDRAPIGDISSTMVSLIQANDQIHFIYRHSTDSGEFVLDTDDLHAQLGDVPLSEPAVLSWIGEYIKENLEDIQGGKI
ncbi:MAG: sensor histidine kinase [Clostridia bacterium]|nr:sensor histidine kinase [Clostridia bacterium]